MIIRIAAKEKTTPCIFRATCQGACEWCNTHSYSEACVPMLQQRVQQLTKQLEQQKDDPLEEIAVKLCQSFPECTEDCMGFHDCRKGRKGTLVWLRRIMEKNNNE